MRHTHKEITIYDIAKKLDVSAATVSRALSDYPGTSEKTKERIRATAKEMGYNFNTYASNLRRKSSSVIGVIVPRLNSSFISDVIAGIEEIVNKAKYTLIVSQSLETMANEVNSTAVMANNRVAGLLVSIANNTSSTAHFESLLNKGIPIVFFDRVYNLPGVPSICIDNHNAAYQVTDHLAKQGCKRIMHVTASLLRNVYDDRYKGYREALADNKLTFSDDMLLINDLSAKDGIETAHHILKMRVKPDGIFFANDNCSVNCMVELKKNHIKIPQDIAIAGFNNDPVTCLIEPNLTTIDYKGHNMGKKAAQILISHLEGKQSLQTVQKLVLKPELLIRQSSLKGTL